MDALELIQHLQARGVSLTLHDTQIWVSPKEHLNEADRLSIRAHKAEVLALLELTPEDRARIAQAHAAVARLSGSSVPLERDTAASLRGCLKALTVCHPPYSARALEQLHSAYLFLVGESA